MRKLSEELKKRNVNLFSKFEHIKELSKSVMSRTNVIFSKYTNHDSNHLKNVEININQIVTDELCDNLSDDELFFLLSAAWLHDIGMIPINNESDEFDKKNANEREEFRNEIRNKHHIRSYAYIQNHKKEFNLSDIEAKAIGKICKGHREIDLNSLSDLHFNNTIHISLLAAILRIADECDISSTRESILSNEGIDEDTKIKHYRIHKLVKKVEFNHNLNHINLISFIYRENDITILESKKNKIQKELNNVKLIFNKNNINLNSVELDIHVDQKFMQNKIILSISKNENIYSINSYFKQDEIEDELELLINNKIIIKEDTFIINSEFEILKKLFRLILNENIGEFFFSDCIQKSVLKSINEIENIFNINLNQSDKEYRLKLLKNSPSAFYLLIYMDEIINYPLLNISSNQNGLLMLDSILSFGLFNDIFVYNQYINFDEIDNVINEFKFLDKEYYSSRIMLCKSLGDYYE